MYLQKNRWQKHLTSFTKTFYITTYKNSSIDPVANNSSNDESNSIGRCNKILVYCMNWPPGVVPHQKVCLVYFLNPDTDWPILWGAFRVRKSTRSADFEVLTSSGENLNWKMALPIVWATYAKITCWALRTEFIVGSISWHERVTIQTAEIPIGRKNPSLI